MESISSDPSDALVFHVSQSNQDKVIDFTNAENDSYVPVGVISEVTDKQEKNQSGFEKVELWVNGVKRVISVPLGNALNVGQNLLFPSVSKSSLSENLTHLEPERAHIVFSSSSFSGKQVNEVTYSKNTNANHVDQLLNRCVATVAPQINHELKRSVQSSAGTENPKVASCRERTAFIKCEKQVCTTDLCQSNLHPNAAATVSDGCSGHVGLQVPIMSNHYDRLDQPDKLHSERHSYFSRSGMHMPTLSTCGVFNNSGPNIVPNAFCPGSNMSRLISKNADPLTNFQPPNHTLHLPKPVDGKTLVSFSAMPQNHVLGLSSVCNSQKMVPSGSYAVQPNNFSRQVETHKTSSLSSQPEYTPVASPQNCLSTYQHLLSCVDQSRRLPAVFGAVEARHTNAYTQDSDVRMRQSIRADFPPDSRFPSLYLPSNGQMMRLANPTKSTEFFNYQPISQDKFLPPGTHALGEQHNRFNTTVFKNLAGGTFRGGLGLNAGQAIHASRYLRQTNPVTQPFPNDLQPQPTTDSCLPGLNYSQLQQALLPSQFLDSLPKHQGNLACFNQFPRHEQLLGHRMLNNTELSPVINYRGLPLSVGQQFRLPSGGVVDCELNTAIFSQRMPLFGGSSAYSMKSPQALHTADHSFYKTIPPHFSQLAMVPQSIPSSAAYNIPSQSSSNHALVAANIAVSKNDHLHQAPGPRTAELSYMSDALPLSGSSSQLFSHTPVFPQIIPHVLERPACFPQIRGLPSIETSKQQISAVSKTFDIETEQSQSSLFSKNLQINNALVANNNQSIGTTCTEIVLQSSAVSLCGAVTSKSIVLNESLAGNISVESNDDINLGGNMISSMQSSCSISAALQSQKSANDSESQCESARSHVNLPNQNYSQNEARDLANDKEMMGNDALQNALEGQALLTPTSPQSELISEVVDSFEKMSDDVSMQKWLDSLMDNVTSSSEESCDGLSKSRTLFGSSTSTITVETTSNAKVCNSTSATVVEKQRNIKGRRCTWIGIKSIEAEIPQPPLTAAAKRRKRRRLTLKSNQSPDVSCDGSSDSWRPDNFTSSESSVDSISTKIASSTSSTCSWSSSDSVTVGRRLRTRKTRKRRCYKKFSFDSSPWHRKRFAQSDFIPECFVSLEVLHMNGRKSINVKRTKKFSCCASSMVVNTTQKKSDSEDSYSSWKPFRNKKRFVRLQI